MNKQAVGIFDSGVGGLSVWRELIKLLPAEKYIYFSDNAFCPYGPKGEQEIIKRAVKITDFLIEKGVKIIVVACNTATAAAIDELRDKYKNMHFIGMEPAVKPAALHSRSGVIGVLATEGTFKGRLYNRTLERFAHDVKVIERVGEGLVEIVESGNIDSSQTNELLERYINPMLSEGADHIVLGCTHYPFLEKNINKITGDSVTVVNPAPAVAQHTKNILTENHFLNTQNTFDYKQSLFYSSGNPSTLRNLVLSIEPDIPNENFINLNI